MSEETPAARRRQGAYLFVRKGARRVTLDEALPERAVHAPSVAELLAPTDGAGGLRHRRPALDPAAIDPRLCFFVHPEAPVCALYRQAAADLRRQADGARVILVTSPHGRAGRTLTTLNLACALAETDRVAIVDLHRHNPGVARAFGLRAPAGLLAAARARRRTPGAPLDVTRLADRLTALCIEPDARPDTLALATLRPILDTLAATADRVLIDGPPVLDGDSLLDLAVLADGVLLVAEPADLASGDYERTLALFEGRRLVGTLLNDRGARAIAPRAR